MTPFDEQAIRGRQRTRLASIPPSERHSTATSRLREAEADLAAALDELTRLREENARLRAAAAKVLEGFDLGVFLRGTSHDADSGWAIRLTPYLSALGQLKGETSE